MPSTSTATAAPTDRVSHITNAPDGIVRLFVPTGVTLSKTELRNVAAKIAKTINVGRVPAGKPGKLLGVAGHVFDFAPVHRGAATPATEEDPRTAVLAGLGLSPEQIAAALAAAPAAAATPAKAKPAKAKAERQVPAFLLKWADVTCKNCRDFGKVRGPGAGEKAGRPFRTQHGADSAPTAVPCPAHVTAASKGKGKRTATA